MKRHDNASRALRFLFPVVFLVGCGTAAANDAGRDAWRFDVTADLTRRDVADVSIEVTPTVDVVVFDATADASLDASFAPQDVTGLTCSALDEAYARTVREAQRCSTASDCMNVVCETACCACQVYVAGTTEQLDALAALQGEWDALGCAASTACMPSRCGAPLTTECTSLGRCATVRRGD